MTSMTSTVGPMQKVSLSLRDASTPPGTSAPAPSSNFDFIYGIGAEGMSAFEQALLGKVAGDVFTLRIEKHALPDFFEHLLCPLMEALSITTPMDLEVRVDAVSPATDREMIRALAEKIGGCAGDCDCGCGC
jgi:hypothetical protein